jgi:hypothetical protein
MDLRELRCGDMDGIDLAQDSFWAVERLAASQEGLSQSKMEDDVMIFFRQSPLINMTLPAPVHWGWFDVQVFTDILYQMAHLQSYECKRTYCSSLLRLPAASLKLAMVPLTFLMLCLSVLLQLILEFIFSCLLSTMQQYQDLKLNLFKICHPCSSIEGTVVSPSFNLLDVSWVGRSM